jgi:hypothetical protein
MIIYTNGCSHTAGGCFKTLFTWPHLLMKSILNFDSYITNPYMTNFDNNSRVLYNHAIHGAGNDYIFHKSLETISSLIQKGNKPDYVFIQWSGPNRRLHFFPDGYVFVNPSDYSDLGVKFEPYGSEHTIHYMFSLQEFLKKNGINYLFFNYMALDKSIKDLSIFKEIDFDNFLNFGMGKSIMFDGLIDFFKSKNMCCDEAGHPNHDANYLITKEIGDRIGVKIIDLKDFHNSIVI